MAFPSGERVYARLREHPRAVRVLKKVATPIRHVAVPVVRGPNAGVRFTVGPSTLWQLAGDREPEVMDALLSALRPGMTVFDVGANVGWCTVTAARAVGPSGQVVAFEPSPRNAATIRRNVERNGLVNVEIALVAAADAAGWVRFNDTSSLNGRIGAGSLHVAICPLDDFAASRGLVPDVVKVDVEGAELLVLDGMVQLLHEHRPVLLIELHGTEPEVVERLVAAGYTHKPLGADHILATAR